MSKIKQIFYRILGEKANRELSANLIITFLIKGGAMLISVLIVPAYARYFSNDTAYGAWLTVASVFTWMTMFDFGIGNGLRNYLVKSLASKDDEASRKYISSAYVSVGLISLLLAVGGSIAVFLLNWNVLLKVPEEVVSLSTFHLYIEIVFLGVVTHFFFLLITSICYALQKTFLPSLFTLLTQCLLLIFLFIPNNAPLEAKVIELSVAYLVSYNIPILITTLMLFNGRLKKVRPSLKYFDKVSTRHIIGLGGMFFVIQLALIALNSSNEIYINIFFESADVVQYNYYHKLFYILLVAMTLITQPIWSAITKAYYEKRYLWIKKVYCIMNGFALILCLGSVLLALIYQPIADIWLGKGVLNVQGRIVIYFCIYTSMNIVFGITNAFSNGLSKIRCQTVCTVLGAVIKLMTIIILTQITSLGWESIMIANIIACFPLFVFQPIYIYKVINNLQKKGCRN